MKLLIVTQVIDTRHPILGFFHRWVEEFAKHFEHVHVIALETGEYRLPENVTVHSLGKETGASFFHKISVFFSLITSLKDEYDAVFVHMNPEYVVLAGWWWRLNKKKTGLWYNHTIGSAWLRIAQPFADTVFHTSPFAYTARYKNSHRMPAGIDTDLFRPHPEVKRTPKSVYFQGRITPAKNVHTLLEAFAILHKEERAQLLTIVGPEDSGYAESLRERYASLIRSGALVFKGPIQHHKTPELYARHSVSVNLTASGNYDKSVLESLAAGTPVVVASRAFEGIVPLQYRVSTVDAVSVAEVISEAFDTPLPTAIPTLVKSRESLERLGSELAGFYE